MKEWMKAGLQNFGCVCVGNFSWALIEMAGDWGGFVRI